MLHSVERCCGIRPMLYVLNCCASVGLNKCQYWVREVGSQPVWVTLYSWEQEADSWARRVPQACTDFL